MAVPERVEAGTARAWLQIVAIVLAAAGWTQFAQGLFAHFDFTNPGPALALFLLTIFGPLMALGVLAGLLFRLDAMAPGRQPLWWCALGLLAGGAALGASLGLSWLYGAVAPGTVLPGSAGLVAVGIMLALFQSLSEEVLFRGWLQPVLVRRIGPVAGIGLGAMIFAAFHAIGATSDPVSLLNMALGGLLFGLLAWRSGGIVAAVAAHFLYNAAEDLGLGLLPGGTAELLGAVVNLDLVGVHRWGGSPEGLNASYGTTIALLAVTLPLLLPAFLALRTGDAGEAPAPSGAAA